MKEPMPKYPETSRGRRARSGAVCVARRGLRDGRNLGRACLPGKEEFPTTQSPASSRTAEQETKQRRENPLFGRNLNPDFARALNTPREVGGVLARIADGLPWTPDAEGYRRLFTRAANHLLPLAHPPNDLRHAINSRRDARSSINASRERRHESEIRRREEYDRDHGIPSWSQATRTESTTASTGGTTWGRSKHHDNHSPPRDRHHPW
jgi:hypothetical protein